MSKWTLFDIGFVSRHAKLRCRNFSNACLPASLTLAGDTIGRCGASPLWGFINQGALLAGIRTQF